MIIFENKSKQNILASRRIFFIGAFLFLSIIAILLIAWRTMPTDLAHAGSRNNVSTVEINGQKIAVELALTPQQQYRGLSNRESLCADCGMLFNFTDSDIKSFVMRNMKFPLDILFINNGVIKNIAADLEAEGSKPINLYQSSGPVNRVLELNAGYCASHGIEPGDKVIF